jgi:hypothetical protein
LQSLSQKFGASRFGGNRSRSRSLEKQYQTFESGNLNQKGQLTAFFRRELQREGEKLARRIGDDLQQDVHPPQQDLFGVTRHKCEECEKDGGCDGYESANNMFSS